MPSCCSAGRVATAAWVVMALVAACTHAQSIETWCNTKCDEAVRSGLLDLPGAPLQSSTRFCRGCRTHCSKAPTSYLQNQITTPLHPATNVSPTPYDPHLSRPSKLLFAVRRRFHDFSQSQPGLQDCLRQRGAVGGGWHPYAVRLPPCLPHHPQVRPILSICCLDDAHSCGASNSSILALARQCKFGIAICPIMRALPDLFCIVEVEAVELASIGICNASCWFCACLGTPWDCRF